MEFRLLKASEIECRIASVRKKGVQLLLYKDARCDMNILDETVGAENWQRSHELINGNLFCNVGINVNKGGEYDRWVFKQDVGTESYTEKEKGQASDSFKRACVNWGIGRELYTSPFIWVSPGKCKIEEENNGKFSCRDRFEVESIQYEDRRIVGLTIINEKTHNVVFSMDQKPDPVMPEPKECITATEAETVKTLLIKKGTSVEAFCKMNGIGDLAEMTPAQYAYTVSHLGLKP